MGLESWIVRKAAPAPGIEGFGSCLFIGPHPDDIEIGAGATVARLSSQKKKISFLICMDGRFGLDYAPEGTTPEKLAEIRKKESLESAERLGVSDVRFLNLSDGGFYDPKELRNGIARVIGEVQPEIVFAPDPAVKSECHEDHLNVGEAVRRLAFFAPFSEIMAGYGAREAPVQAAAFYMTATPNRFVRISGYTKRQLDAIRCHASQFPEDSDALKQVELYLKIRGILFGLRSRKGRAEGFRVLGRTQMHCLPEAGFP